MKSRLKRRFLPSGEVERTLPLGIGRGVRMGIDFHRGETQLYLGLYERELNRVLRQICRRGYRGFDLGGHFGYDALVMAKLTGERVVSVEGEPGYAEAIRRNAERNPDLVVEVVESWIDATEGPGSTTIDALARRFGPPDVVKVDIEGAEAAALLGAREVLAVRRPHLLVEVHGRAVEDACQAELRRAGYDPRAIDRRRWLPEHRPLEHNRWLVCQGRDR